MKNFLAALLCTTILASFACPVVSFADDRGTLGFFHTDNLMGSLSFDYSHPSATEAEVSIKNITTSNSFYLQTHPLEDGTLSLKEIPLVGEGSFRLTVKAESDEIIHDFTYLTADYEENFPTVTGDEVYSHISNLTSDSHPYLFAGASEFEELSKKIKSGTDPYLTKSYREIKEAATTYLTETPKAINPDGDSYISRGFDGWKIVMFCSFVYLIEKSTNEQEAVTYAQRAFDEANYFCSLEHWGTNQYIDNNQLAFAVALCYDWLYGWLDDTQKNTLVESLRGKHLDTLYDMFQNPDREQYQTTFYLWYFGGGNHTVLDNSATAVQALAIADLDPDYSAEIIASAMNNLHKPLSRLAPDSVWLEGAGYWTFVGPFVARMIDAFDSALGTSFGYSELPVVKNLGYFPIYQQSSQGSFVFCDAGDSLVTSPERFYFGQLNSDLGMQSFSLATSPANPLLCLWYEPGTDYSDTSSFQKDMLYRNGDNVTMRSDWGSENELFVAMSVNKFDAESVAGLYQNSGTFAIDAIGEQWIKNPGRDNYDLPSYAVPHKDASDKRWKYYFSRAEANSCVVINPDEYGGQNILFGDTISGFKASDSEAFAYASLNGAYRDDVDSYMRAIKMFDNRRRVLVKDEIALKSPSEVYSFLSVYQSDIELLDDESGAILSKGNKKMLVKIQANQSFDLSVMDAVQMDSSLRYEGDDTHPAETDWTENFRRLALHFEDAENLDISMIFVPFYGSEIPSVSFDNTAIADWNLSETEKLPQLSEVYLNGEKLESFNPDENYHNLISDSPNPAFSALSDDGSVAIHKSDSGYVVVVTSDSGIANTYHFSISVLGTVTADTWVGGGIDTYRKNYGSNETVEMMINSWSSRLGYYKIDLGNIPEGKRVKSVKLELSVCRESSSEATEPLGFYLTDYNSWNESGITCSDAPISLGYKKSVSSDPWFPIKSYDAISDTYTNINPNITINHKFGHTVPFSYSIDESDYEKEVIDLTEVYNAGGKKEKFAFAIAISKKSSANSLLHIGAKENSNPALRPQVLVELEDDLLVMAPKLVLSSDYEPDAAFELMARQNSVRSGDELRAVASIANSGENIENGKICVAQYDEDGCLVAITQTSFGSVLTGTTLCPASDKFTVLPETTQIKTFVWSGEDVPFATAAEVYTLQY